jgi:hypothetical protein
MPARPTHFVRLPQATPHLILGEILWADDLDPPEDGDHDWERGLDAHQARLAEARGLLVCRCHSAVVPGGETGLVRADLVCPVDPEDVRWAQARGFRVTLDELIARRRARGAPVEEIRRRARAGWPLARVRPPWMDG